MANATFSGPDKLIIVNSGVTSIDVRQDIYSDWKEWVAGKGDFSGSTEDNSKFLFALTAIGGDQISETLNLGTTFFLENGWKVRPYEWTHALTVVGNIYSRDGSSPFVPTIGNYNVVINTRTSNLVDLVNAGSPSAIAQAVWSRSVDSTEFSGNTVGKTVVETYGVAGDNQALILAGL